MSGRIPDSFIEELLSRTDIVEVVERRVDRTHDRLGIVDHGPKRTEHGGDGEGEQSDGQHDGAEHGDTSTSEVRCLTKTIVRITKIQLILRRLSFDDDFFILFVFSALSSVSIISSSCVSINGFTNLVAFMS